MSHYILSKELKGDGGWGKLRISKTMTPPWLVAIVKTTDENKTRRHHGGGWGGGCRSGKRKIEKV